MMTPLISSSVEETAEIARNFATKLRRGNVVALYGELGTGKTQFVKGVAKALGVGNRVLSPTFVLIHRYIGTDTSGTKTLLYHADLYRIRSEEELFDIGFEEIVGADAITLIEWADRLVTLLPQNRFDVHMALGNKETERVITITPVRSGVPAQHEGNLAGTS